jgi:hypothetical protein
MSCALLILELGIQLPDVFPRAGLDVMLDISVASTESDPVG